VDLNPFAPPRTTDLDPRDAPASPELRTLEPDAVRMLVSGGKWAQWAAGLAAAVAGLMALWCVMVAAGMGWAARPSLIILTNIVSLPLLGLVVWLSRRFGNAARALAQDEGDHEADRLMRLQRQLFTTYGILGLVVALLMVAMTVFGFFMGRLGGSGEIGP
jgi:hypothetical protein